MDQAYAAIKNLWMNMQAIGWAPWPAAICIAVMIFVRKYTEDDVLDVTTPEAKAKLMQGKKISLLVGYTVSLLACYGFDPPQKVDDGIQAVVFSALNMVMGYMAWSIWVAVDPITRIKNRFFPGGKNETPTTPAP